MPNTYIRGNLLVRERQKERAEEVTKSIYRIGRKEN
jgi:hypothetical protein